MAKLAAAGVAFFVVLLLLIGGGAIAVVQAVFGSSAQGTSCIPTGAPIGGYGPEEMGHAATIVAVGKQMSVPEQGWIIAITTAITESRLRNLTYGDRDSIGIFQQRPSQGWGSVAQIMNPNYSSEQFYRHLMALPNWQTTPVAESRPNRPAIRISRPLRTVRTSRSPDRRSGSRRGLHNQRCRRLQRDPSPHRRCGGRDLLRMQPTWSPLRLGRKRSRKRT